MGQGKFTSVHTNDHKFCLFDRLSKQVEVLGKLLPRIEQG